MANETDKNVVPAQAAKEPSKKEAAPVRESRQEVTAQEAEGVEVHFNPSARVGTFVLADGTRVQDGDVVEQGVMDQLQDVVLDGDKLLVEEEGE